VPRLRICGDVAVLTPVCLHGVNRDKLPFLTLICGSSSALKVKMVRKGKTVSSTRGNNTHAHFKQAKPPASHNVRVEYTPNVGAQDDVLMLSTDITRYKSHQL